MTFDEAIAIGVQEIRKPAVYDWIQAYEVAAVARSLGASTNEDIRELTLSIVERAIRTGIARVGHASGSFEPFDEPLTVTFERVRREWPRDRQLYPGELFWLDVDPF